MLKNIFKLAIRNFFKNRIYSITIVLSLAIGFSVASILIGFIIHELNTDSFIVKKDRIFRLLSDDPFQRGSKMSYHQRNTIDFIDSNFPEIESSCLIYPLRQYGISQPGEKEKITGLNILSADSTFFNIFNFPFYLGNPARALEKGNIVLTINTAKKLFGPDYINAREVEIKIDTITRIFKISGFTESPVENSHLLFDAMVANEDLSPHKGGIAYLLTKPGNEAKKLENKINSSGKVPGIMGDGKLIYYFQPLQKIYWDENNTRTFSIARNKIFLWASSSVVFLVLFLAAFNFLNLFIISFNKRWKEFGIKKIMGASMFSIQLMTITEVLLYILFSFICSILISYLVLPYFDNLFSAGLSFQYFIHPSILILLVMAMSVISLAVIMKLSNYLYGIKPVSLLSNKPSAQVRFNQWMPGIQFVISIVLVSCSIVMIRQTNYIKTKPLGFYRNILELRSPSRDFDRNLVAFKQEILNLPGIQSASVCSGTPFSDNMIARYDLDDGQFYTPYIYIGDEDYLKTMGINLISGKLPSPGNTNERLVNLEFVRYFQLDNPIGKTIPGTKDEYICGIVNDFNIASLKQNIPPVIINYSDQSETIIMNYDPEHISQLLPLIKQKWNMLFLDFPFKYLFVSDELNNRHADDILFGRIITSSTFISILITCFGLFALSWGTTQDRSREIGIRKVIGASWLDVLVLLLKGFFKWILVAYIIAIPVAWYLAHRWLESFSYKIKLNFWIFLEAGISIIMITLLTISYQTLKSSMTNPVDELKYE